MSDFALRELKLIQFSLQVLEERKSALPKGFSLRDLEMLKSDVADLVQLRQEGERAERKALRDLRDMSMPKRASK